MALPAFTHSGLDRINGTPDAEYPLRILRAYRANCDAKWNIKGLGDDAKAWCDEMTKIQVQRAMFLDDAITTLEAVG